MLRNTGTKPVLRL